MNSRVILFVDHEIGYRLLEKSILKSATYGFELVAVVTTQSNGKMWWSGVSDLCEKNNIPLHRYDESFEVAFGYVDIDWFFLISWKHIIPLALINRAKNGAINLHYSLLPEYRGVYPVNWAIMDGKQKTGVTYHIANEEIDAGQIVCQKDLLICLYDTARSLQLRLDDLAYELFDEMIARVIFGSARLNVQPSHKTIQASYKSRSDFIASNEIDLNRKYRAIDLINLLRGKTFLSNSKNLYFVDPVSGERIYINICLSAGER